VTDGQPVTGPTAPRRERDKLVAGDVYLASDPDLVAARAVCRDLLAEFNGLLAADPAARRAVLERLLGSVGEGVEITPPFHCDYGWAIEAGPGVFANFGLVVLDGAPVRIGAATQIGPNVQILTADHPRDPVARRRGDELSRAITIGENVWLGAGAIVCPGVSIGDDTVVGAGSVVTRDLPARVVAVGAPCRVVSQL
jgi:maltose O-acetyltransferase